MTKHVATRKETQKSNDVMTSSAFDSKEFEIVSELGNVATRKETQKSNDVMTSSAFDSKELEIVSELGNVKLCRILGGTPIGLFYKILVSRIISQWSIVS